MSGRALYVALLSASCAYVRGYGSRELLIELRNGRIPMRSSTERAWVCQEKTARDLMALADARGYRVVLEDRRAA